MGLRNEYGTVTQSSSFEVEVGEYYIHVFGPSRTSTAYNKGPAVRFVPTLTSPDIIMQKDNGQKAAIWAHECKVHGCRKCTRPDQKFFSKTMKQARESTRRKVEKFKRCFPSCQIIQIWECDWEDRKKSDRKTREFFEQHKMRPTQRLVPRDCVRPSLVCTYGHFFDSSSSNEKFVTVDVNSAFAFSAVKNEVPWGRATLLTDHELGKRLCWDDVLECYTIDGISLIGIALAFVVCPRDHKMPYVACHEYDRKSNDDRWQYVNCHECLKQANTGKCDHSVAERGFHVTLCVPEINYIKTIGYFVQILEVLSFETTSSCISDFSKVLASHKLKYSGWPKGAKSTCQRQKYCDEVNNQMGFKNSLKLTIDNVAYNSEKKQQFKGSLNQFYGRLQMRLDNGVTRVFSNLQDFYQAWTELPGHDEFDRVRVVANSLYATRATRRNEVPKISRNSLMVQGAHIVAHAKISIHRQACKLESAGAKVFSIDTDGISFSSNIRLDLLLNVHNCIGAFKVVHENVLRYVCMSDRRYSIEKLGNDGSVMQCSIYSGLKTDFSSKLLLPGVLKKIADGDDCVMVFETTKQCKSIDTGVTQNVTSRMTVTGPIGGGGRIVNFQCCNLFNRGYGYQESGIQ